MKFAQAEADVRELAAQIAEAWTAWPLTVEINNVCTVDTNTYDKPFLQIQYMPLAGEQADIGAAPRTHQYGQIMIAVVCRLGAGTVEALELFDFCAPYFHLKDLALLRLQAFEATRHRTDQTWYYMPGAVATSYLW